MRKRGCGDQEKSAQHASSDEVEIETFCSKVCIEEISFEAWQEKHEKLDLTYPLRIKRSELTSKPSTLVRLSRTIVTTSERGKKVETRERFECEVCHSRDLEQTKVLKFPGLGDRCGDAVGDLLIILEILD